MNCCKRQYWQQVTAADVFFNVLDIKEMAVEWKLSCHFLWRWL